MFARVLAFRPLIIIKKLYIKREKENSILFLLIYRFKGYSR
jgi:hypothetical protein